MWAGAWALAWRFGGARSPTVWSWPTASHRAESVGPRHRDIGRDLLEGGCVPGLAGGENEAQWAAAAVGGQMGGGPEPGVELEGERHGGHARARAMSEQTSSMATITAAQLRWRRI